ncbi:hypothetical protein BDR26DRAFT_857156, partial [Obelidium mucronatum]
SLISRCLTITLNRSLPHSNPQLTPKSQESPLPKVPPKPGKRSPKPLPTPPAAATPTSSTDSMIHHCLQSETATTSNSKTNNSSNSDSNRSILFISDGDRSDSTTLVLQLIESVRHLLTTSPAAASLSWNLIHSQWHSELDFNDPLLFQVDRVVYVAKTEMRIREKLVGKVAEEYKRICGDKFLLVFYETMSSTAIDPNPYWEGGVMLRATYQSSLVSSSAFNDSQLKEIVDILSK